MTGKRTRRMIGLIRDCLHNRPDTTKIKRHGEEPFEAGPESLLVAVLVLAVKDMNQAPSTNSWPAKRIDAARWFLEGEESEGGVSLSLVAKTFDLDPGKIREAVGAREKFEYEITELQKKRISKSRRARMSGQISEAMDSGE